MGEVHLTGCGRASFIFYVPFQFSFFFFNKEHFCSWILLPSKLHILFTRKLLYGSSGYSYPFNSLCTRLGNYIVVPLDTPAQAALCIKLESYTVVPLGTPYQGSFLYTLLENCTAVPLFCYQDNFLYTILENCTAVPLDTLTKTTLGILISNWDENECGSLCTGIFPIAMDTH